MVSRNPNFSNLSQNYLFPEVARKVKEFSLSHPKASLISLSVGDTTQPIPKGVVSHLKKAALDLGTKKNYRGYGAEQGQQVLRQSIASILYKNRIAPEEVFVSDGAKCDIGRLQVLFGNHVTIAVQDPSYPVYVDTSLILGQKKIHYLSCNPENGFLPDLNQIPKVDLLYFCSPNNPTGAAAPRKYLEELIKIVTKNKTILIFDAAYSAYIEDPKIPHSIYEIEGAKGVAIEVSSFSKLIGFTGVRLGWTIVPKELKYEDGKSVFPDWSRIVTTFFNGASNIAQKGGIATLLDEKAIEQMVAYYKENSRLLKDALEAKGLRVFGGTNAPYLWTQFKGKKSWEVFQTFLEELHLITTPGVGFGQEGEGFIRITGFGKREQILKAISRMEKKWPQNLL